jgi:hypothetical protein
VDPTRTPAGQPGPDSERRDAQWIAPYHDIRYIHTGDPQGGRATSGHCAAASSGLKVGQKPHVGPQSGSIDRDSGWPMVPHLPWPMVYGTAMVCHCGRGSLAVRCSYRFHSSSRQLSAVSVSSDLLVDLLVEAT